MKKNLLENHNFNSEIKSNKAIFNSALGLFFILFGLNQNSIAQSVDLSTYVRVGRYNLPEPTRTAHPDNNLLAQEASAVTYNWDTNTLFIVGDGSTAIVQVSKTGQLIDTMTLAQGTSPQGTEFYDTEGLTYIGNGQFVMTEERDRQVVKFTYTAGTTLTRSNTQTVKLGTFVGNFGTEGLSFDPLTSGYIVLKETRPIGIFQTALDFITGTATNGSATTANSLNLFDSALMEVKDVADIFALSNLPALNGLPLYNNLLVLSQENAKVLNIDRNGAITSSLTIVSDPEDILDLANQQHEGLTMDRDRVLYIISENGGGDIDHPQLWVYTSSTLTNAAPKSDLLTNANSLFEISNTTSAVKIADIVTTDDGLWTGVDKVNLYNTTTNTTPQTSMLIGASSNTTFANFDNSAGLNSLITPIKNLSSIDVNGVLVAASSAVEIGAADTFVLSGVSMSANTFQETDTDLNVTAYPNPFDSAFQLNLKTISTDKVEMKVYDMIGKLVEISKLDATEMNNQKAGSIFKSGIYNVIITQGKKSKTLRVIKK